MTTKTATTAFPVITTNASKAEEIQHLRAFSASLPEQSYLADFLSEKCIDWFAGRVQSDLNTGLFETLEYERKQYAEGLTAERKAREDVQAKLTKVNRSLANLQGELDAVSDRLDEQRVRAVKAEAEVRRLTGELEDAQIAVRELKAEVRRLTGELEDAQIAVRELKAKLFDLLVASGKIAL